MDQPPGSRGRPFIIPTDPEFLEEQRQKRKRSNGNGKPREKRMLRVVITKGGIFQPQQPLIEIIKQNEIDERKRKRARLNIEEDVVTSILSATAAEEEKEFIDFINSLEDNVERAEAFSIRVKEKANRLSPTPTTISTQFNKNLRLTSSQCPSQINFRGLNISKGLKPDEILEFSNISLIHDVPYRVLFTSKLKGKIFVKFGDTVFSNGDWINMNPDKPEGMNVVVKIEPFSLRDISERHEGSGNSEYDITFFAYFQLIKGLVSFNTIKPIKFLQCVNFTPPKQLGTSDYQAYDQFNKIVRSGGLLEINIFEQIDHKDMYHVYFNHPGSPPINDPSFEAPSIIIQLLYTLESLLRLGTLHLDWKLNNIMLPWFSKRALDIPSVNESKERQLEIMKKLYGLEHRTDVTSVDQINEWVIHHSKNVLHMVEDRQKKRRGKHYPLPPVIPLHYVVTPSKHSPSPLLGRNMQNKPIHFSVIEAEGHHMPIVIDYGMSQVIDIDTIRERKRGDRWDFVSQLVYTLEYRPPEIWFKLHYNVNASETGYRGKVAGVYIGPKGEIFALGLVCLDVMNTNRIRQLKKEKGLPPNIPMRGELGQSDILIHSLSIEHAHTTIYNQFSNNYIAYAVDRQDKDMTYPLFFFTNGDTNYEDVDVYESSVKYLWALVLLLGLPPPIPKNYTSPRQIRDENDNDITFFRTTRFYKEVFKPLEGIIEKLENYNFIKKNFKKKDNIELLLNILNRDIINRKYPYDILINPNFFKNNLVTPATRPPISRICSMNNLLTIEEQQEKRSQQQQQQQRSKREGMEEEKGKIDGQSTTLNNNNVDDLHQCIEQLTITNKNNQYVDDDDTMPQQSHKQVSYNIEFKNSSSKDDGDDKLSTDTYNIQYKSEKVPHPWGLPAHKLNPTARVRAHRHYIPLDEYIKQCSANKMYKKCSNCNKLQSATLQCGKCKLAYYCNDQCQQEHWEKGHFHACNHVQRLK